MSEDILTSPEAGGRVIRGSVVRVAGHLSGVVLMAAASVLLLRHLGVVEAGRYFTVMALVAVTGTLAEAGLNIVGARELAVRPEAERTRLLANLLGLRALITPVGVAVAVGFALAAGYTEAMIWGTLLAGIGLILVSLQATVMLRLVVELRNGRVALAELIKQVVTVVGIAALVIAGAALLPFFAVQIAVGVVIVAVTPLLVGRGALIRPRWDRDHLRWLVREALPIAGAFVLGALYFRIVILLMSVISPEYEVGLFGTSLRIMETLAGVPVLVAGTALPVLAGGATRCSA